MKPADLDLQFVQKSIEFKKKSYAHGVLIRLNMVYVLIFISCTCVLIFCSLICPPTLLISHTRWKVHKQNCPFRCGFYCDNLIIPRMMFIWKQESAASVQSHTTQTQLYFIKGYLSTVLKNLVRFIPQQSRKDKVSVLALFICASYHSICPSGTISQYLLVRVDPFLI